MWLPEQTIAIGNKHIGKDFPLFAIAEAGVAHFGSLEKALNLVDMAADAGADAVKFQMFDVEDLVSSASLEWKQRLKSRQLRREDFYVIQEYCSEKAILFLCTAHDLPSVDFLHQNMRVPAFKVGSGEVGNIPYLRRIASLGLPVIVSTGMHQMVDIQNVLDIFREADNPQLVLLHCVTGYPVAPSNANLMAIPMFRERFCTITGYSDHTAGTHIALAAVALGALVIEKHISLDFDVPDAHDWKVSCGPHNLASFLRELRDIENALGNGLKELTQQEQESLRWARKSLVAACDIHPGVQITGDMVQLKRPGTGLSAAELPQILGRTAREFILRDTLLTLDMLW